MTPKASSFDMDKGFYIFTIIVVSNDDKSRKNNKKDAVFGLKLLKMHFFQFGLKIRILEITLIFLFKHMQIMVHF